jgi:anti-sigma factor ChrR (cupin superfamily)
MSGPSCEQTDNVYAYALASLPAADAAAMETHVASCSHCREELESLRPAMHAFASWPTDELRPPSSLQQRLSERIATETGTAVVPPPSRQWTEPAWESVAPGIEVKQLALDPKRNLVSMLVRLAPNAEYPPHTHAGVEELHLLDGELWIDERKLYPGDYNHAVPGTGDKRVWSETGCTCVLITSISDQLH